MKIKTLLYIILLSNFISLGYAQTRSLQINKNDGTTINIKIDIVSKITFTDSTMVVNMKNGTNNSIPINTIRSFAVGVSTDLIDAKAYGISIYPNPATNIIQLFNIDSQATPLSIYSITGQLLIRTQVSASDNAVNISGLKSGIYIVVTNHQTIKLTKR